MTEHQVDPLALALCATYHDCAEVAGWATCDHALGMRDAAEVRALMSGSDDG